MCYLVVKSKYKHGCYAMKTQHGESLIMLKRKLNGLSRGKGIQVVTISRPSAYGEYSPYTFVGTESELEAATKELIK